MPHKRMTIVLTVAMLWAAGCAQPDRRVSPRAAAERRAAPKENKWRPTSRLANAKRMQHEAPKILPETHFAAGRLFESQGLFGKAIHQYRKAVSVNHYYAEAYGRLGLLLSMTGSRTEAVDAFRSAAKLKPRDATLKNNLGFELLLAQRWAEAEHVLTQAIRLRPDFPRAYINLGIAQSKLGKFNNALASFRTVLPEADAHYNVGLMYRGQQRYADAAGAFRRVLALDTNFVAAQTQLDELIARLPPVQEIEVKPAAVVSTVATQEPRPALHRSPRRPQAPRPPPIVRVLTRAEKSAAKPKSKRVDSQWDQTLAHLDALLQEASPSPVPTKRRKPAPRERVDVSSLRETRSAPSVSRDVPARSNFVDGVLSVLENEFNCVEDQFLGESSAVRSALTNPVSVIESQSESRPIHATMATPLSDRIEAVADAAASFADVFCHADTPMTWCDSSSDIMGACWADAPMRVARGFDAGNTIDSWALLHELETQLDLVRNDINCLESSREQPAMLVATADASDMADPFAVPLVDAMGPPVLGAMPRDVRLRTLEPFDVAAGRELIIDLIDNRGAADSRGARQIPSRESNRSAKEAQGNGVIDPLRRARDRKPVSSTRSIGARWMFDQTGGLFGMTMDNFDRWQYGGTVASIAGGVAEPSGITRRPTAWPFVAFDIDAGLFPDPVYGPTNDGSERSMFVTPEEIQQLEPINARADLGGVLANPIRVIQNRP